MKKHSIFLLFLFLTSAEAKTEFAPTLRLDQTQLSLVGTGTRSATIFSIDVYDAAFYSAKPIASANDAITLSTPKVIELRYLRSVSLSDTNEAWVFTFRESANLTSEDLDPELAQFLSFQEPIEKYDVQRFEMNSTGTKFLINGKLKGIIPGERFKKAFLTIFFGEKPPTDSLKEGLLKIKKE